MPYLFERTSTLPVPVETAFAWHTRPGAIQRMMPPWDQVELLYSDGNVRDGSRVKLRVPLLGPIRKTWIAEHFGYQENVQFGDRQISGPFGSFVHHHRFQAEGPDQSRLTDHIEYTPPLGLFGLPGLPIIRGECPAPPCPLCRPAAAEGGRHGFDRAGRPGSGAISDHRWA